MSFFALAEFQRELSELLSAYYLCANANSPGFWQNSSSLPKNSVSSLLRNSFSKQYSARFHGFEAAKRPKIKKIRGPRGSEGGGGALARRTPQKLLMFMVFFSYTIALFNPLPKSLLGLQLHLGIPRGITFEEINLQLRFSLSRIEP